jgi:hypothetical protein
MNFFRRSNSKYLYIPPPFIQIEMLQLHEGKQFQEDSIRQHPTDTFFGATGWEISHLQPLQVYI